MDFFRNIYNKWYAWRVSLHRRNYWLGALTHVFSIIVVAFILVFIFTIIILQPYHVRGSSMEPTLQEGDRLFILRLGKITANIFGTDYVPKRGEIIIFHNPGKNDKWIKRVIGLPGERLVIENNKITIYNQEYPRGFEPNFNLDPPLPDFPLSEPRLDRTVNQGEVFVLGDNRLPGQSDDSRGPIGNIPVEDIDGVVLIRVVPILDFRFF